MSHRKWLLALPAGALLIFSLAHAQDAQPQPDRGRRGGFDPARIAQFRQQRMNELKDRLGTNDDEWKVMQPKVEKVMSARRDAMGDFGFGFRGGRDRGRDRGPSDQPESAVGKAQRELRTTVENKSASTEEITTKLKALREAREKARAQLAAAQKDLKDVCTPRQEAVLVADGMLE